MPNFRQTLFALCLAAVGTASCAAQSPAASDLTMLAKTMTQQMSTHDYAKVEANFDQEMASALPAEKLQQTWEETIAEVGAFRSILGTSESEQQGYDVVLVTVKFDKMTLDMRWVFGGKNKVAGLFFAPTH